MELEKNGESSIVSSNLESQVRDEFRRSLDLLTAYAASENVTLIPYTSPELTKFESLPLEQRQRISSALTDYCDTMTDLKEQNEFLRYNLNSVWLTLRKTGLRADNDLFTNLTSNDIVEIYTLEGLQIFRSFHFFQYCSYDLETIFTTPWYELFERSSEFDLAYMTLFQNLVTHKIKTTTTLDIPAHPVRERAARRRSSVLDPKLVSPLVDRHGDLKGYVHVVQIINDDC